MELANLAKKRQALTAELGVEGLRAGFRVGLGLVSSGVRAEVGAWLQL